ncbi:NADP-dependent oxidoreductase [Gordonia sp. VNK21]|uniref:NADP-dependent oxidoreductase n=1 Tax=Gordonia sp. VNK21 TaxID=3382483 RepID=UPI0038D4FC01
MTTSETWIARGSGGLDDFAVRPLPVSAPEPGEITVRVRYAGVNPADLKHAMRPGDPDRFPMPIGYEISGTVTAVGRDTPIGSGPVAVGDEVVAFRIHGGYTREITIAARDAFARPVGAPADQAAGLLLAGCTAAELLERSGARRGDTVLLHGASGAVGAIALQLARAAGITVVGTAGPDNLAAVRRYHGIAVPYGPGLAGRVREAAPGGVVAALDAAGTDEAVAASLELVPDRARIVTVAAAPAAREHGFLALAGTRPASAAFRDAVRPELIAMLGDGRLEVPVAGIVPLSGAREALETVAAGRARGKVLLDARAGE